MLDQIVGSLNVLLQAVPFIVRRLFAREFVSVEIRPPNTIFEKLSQVRLSLVGRPPPKLHSNTELLCDHCQHRDCTLFKQSFQLVVVVIPWCAAQVLGGLAEGSPCLDVHRGDRGFQIVWKALRIIWYLCHHPWTGTTTSGAGGLLVDQPG